MTTDINSFIVYGHTGVGKTFLTAQVMHDALWLVTRKSNVGGYNTWLRKNPEEAAKLGMGPIKSIVQIPKMMPAEDGSGLVPTDVRALISEIVTEYVNKAIKGETKVRGLVFDELSILAKWVYDDIRKKERNGFAAIGQIKEWMSELCEISAVTGLPMAFICHSKDPAYWEDGAKKGKLKYKGGPAMPIGTMIAEVCALPDAVLQVDVEQEGFDGTKRVIKTEAHPYWERKCRVWGIDPVIEPDLRPLLTEAGWTFNQAA